MEDFKFYEVGGKIRDELLGLTNKDVDYVAVPRRYLLDVGCGNSDGTITPLYTAEDMFRKLEGFLRSEKFEIFLITPECYTIRAKFPEGYKYQGVADFVMARKEVGYPPGTRIPIVLPGNLYDDLSRRDFTVNAMAKDPDTGEIIDYFGGMEDLRNRVLMTPLDPLTTLDDDPLRILRGIRFAVTKGFVIPEDLMYIIKHYPYKHKMHVVSEERIREELTKCFKCNTVETLEFLHDVPRLRDYIFERTNLWLKPTNEK